MGVGSRPVVAVELARRPSLGDVGGADGAGESVGGAEDLSPGSGVAARSEGAGGPDRGVAGLEVAGTVRPGRASDGVQARAGGERGLAGSAACARVVGALALVPGALDVGPDPALTGRPEAGEADGAGTAAGIAGAGAGPGGMDASEGKRAVVAVAGRVVVRGGGSPEPAEPFSSIGRGQAGMVPVGMCPAEPVPNGEGIPGDVWGRVPAAATAGPVAGREEPGFVVRVMPAGAPCGTGVSTGGRDWAGGAGRGTGVSMGMGPGAECPGGSSLNGAGVARGGVVGVPWRRSSGISRLRISGGALVGSAPGSQAVHSPCGGNSAPHLRHLDTAA